MSSISLRILDLLHEEIINADEAVRLLKAAGESTGRRVRTAAARLAQTDDDTVFIPEMAGLTLPDHFVNGNITLR